MPTRGRRIPEARRSSTRRPVRCSKACPKTSVECPFWAPNQARTRRRASACEDLRHRARAREGHDIAYAPEATGHGAPQTRGNRATRRLHACVHNAAFTTLRSQRLRSQRLRSQTFVESAKARRRIRDSVDRYVGRISRGTVQIARSQRIEPRRRRARYQARAKGSANRNGLSSASGIREIRAIERGVARGHTDGLPRGGPRGTVRHAYRDAPRLERA